MKYAVQHVTRYRYSSAVDLASHLLHLRPRALPHQRLLEERLLISPQPARRSDRIDHYGNQATLLFIDRPHAEFAVTSEAVVDVRFPDPPDEAATPPWEAVVEAARRGGPGAWEASEFRFGSLKAPPLPAAAAYARPSFPPGRPVLQGLRELTRRIRHEFTFRAGVTTLSTPISQVLERRQGVCQDFTHLMIAALRGLGLPARYTSGYIRTYPPAGQARLRGADASHAWVGAWMGPQHGWVDCDPTNGILARDEHVVVAWGRDYGDISPVWGMITGGGSHKLDVAVDLEPLGE